MTQDPLLAEIEALHARLNEAIERATDARARLAVGIPRAVLKNEVMHGHRCLCAAVRDMAK
jgi:hypothetical protein